MSYTGANIFNAGTEEHPVWVAADAPERMEISQLDENDVIIYFKSGNWMTIEGGNLEEITERWSEEDPDDTKIFAKYIDHVAMCEGVDFIGAHHRNHSAKHGVVFTDEEWERLEEIGKGEL